MSGAFGFSKKLFLVQGNIFFYYIKARHFADVYACVLNTSAEKSNLH